MKKLIILIALMITCTITTTSAQQIVKEDDSGNFENVKSETKTSAKLTTKTYTNKGKTYKVYISANGKYFVIRTSAKGNEYKQYLKVSE